MRRVALTRQKLQRSAQRSIQELIVDLDAWVSAWNDDPKPFVWQETADQIFDSLEKCLMNF